jgi:hypothetical protein
MELSNPVSDTRVVLWVPYDGRLQRQDVARMLATSAPRELRDSTNLEVKFSRNLDHVFVEVVLDNETIERQECGTKPKSQVELVSTTENHLRRQRIRRIFTEIKSGDFKLIRCKVKGCRVFFHRREDALKHTLMEHLKGATVKITSSEKRAYLGERRSIFPKKSQHLDLWSENLNHSIFLSSHCTQHSIQIKPDSA